MSARPLDTDDMAGDTRPREWWAINWLRIGPLKTKAVAVDCMNTAALQRRLARDRPA